MDLEEVHSILAEHLVGYRTRSYAELASRVWDGRVDTAEVVAHGGYNCQIEIQCFWDDKPDGRGRVFGSISDGRGTRAFVPLMDSFILSLEGRFVGE